MKTSVSHRLLRISKNSKKRPNGWMFDDWVMGLREDNYVNRPFPSFENSLFQKEARCSQIVKGLYEIKDRKNEKLRRA